MRVTFKRKSKDGIDVLTSQMPLDESCLASASVPYKDQLEGGHVLSCCHDDDQCQGLQFSMIIIYIIQILVCNNIMNDYDIMIMCD